MKFIIILSLFLVGCASAPPTPMPKITYTGDKNNATTIGTHNFKVIDECKQWAGLGQHAPKTGQEMVEMSNSPDPVMFIPMVGSSIYQLKLSKMHRDALISSAFFKDCVKANQIDQPPASVMYPHMSPDAQKMMDAIRKSHQQ